MISVKRLEHKAQLARQHFAQHGPCDAPPLPLDHIERGSIHGTSPLNTMVGLYARSWQVSDYDLERHPSFYEYACGAMASEYNGWPGLASDPEMLRRFPPRKLIGLGPGLIWERKKQAKGRRRVCH